MLLTFYGVRGSIPSPSPHTVKYGGNTSCVHAELASGQDLVFDAGTGLRVAGQHLARKSGPVYIALTHQHWDHIQGYPFFAPIYQPERDIKVLTSAPSTHEVLCSLLEQMDGFNFPLKATDLPSRAECIFGHAQRFLAARGIDVQTQALNHPGGGSAYRLNDEGVSCAYVTDNELSPPQAPGTSYEEWVAFCQGVDVLIHDAQYTDADMPHKHGWGHSLIAQVRQLALDAEVGALVMFHHDPERTDGELDEIQRENERFFTGQRAPAASYCAREGQRLRLTPRPGSGTTRVEVC